MWDASASGCGPDGAARKRVFGQWWSTPLVASAAAGREEPPDLGTGHDSSRYFVAPRGLAAACGPRSRGHIELTRRLFLLHARRGRYATKAHVEANYRDIFLGSNRFGGPCEGLELRRFCPAQRVAGGGVTTALCAAGATLD